MKKVSLEICCGGIEDVMTVKDLDIDRIELNSALELGGLTPSISVLKKAKEICNLPIMTMVRSMSGSFIYSKEELGIMYQDAKILIENGSDGLVFGVLDNDGNVDIENLKPFVKLSKDNKKQFVFHKAFDYVKNQEKEINSLINLGVDRILLMGEKDIDDCADNIRYLNDKYKEKIELLAGGGLNEENILSFIKRSGISMCHGTFKEKRYDDITDSSKYYVCRKRAQEIIKIIQNM